MLDVRIIGCFDHAYIVLRPFCLCFLFFFVLETSVLSLLESGKLNLHQIQAHRYDMSCGESYTDLTQSRCLYISSKPVRSELFHSSQLNNRYSDSSDLAFTYCSCCCRRPSRIGYHLCCIFGLLGDCHHSYTVAQKCTEMLLQSEMLVPIQIFTVSNNK